MSNGIVTGVVVDCNLNLETVSESRITKTFSNE
jgi:hypothetical protein